MDEGEAREAPGRPFSRQRIYTIRAIRGCPDHRALELPIPAYALPPRKCAGRRKLRDTQAVSFGRGQLAAALEPGQRDISRGVCHSGGRGAEAASRLLEYRFDYIFFTGGLSTGRRVMQAAAVHATPITLELGGKNPCIVHSDVQIRYAARGIAWGKFFNAGQTCIAPDYLLVDRRIKHAIIEGISNSISEFYGRDPSTSTDYGRIINQSHFDRLNRLLKSTRGRLVAGGDMDETERYIGPAILDNISPDDPVMGEEIFGPLLPVMEYEDIDRALSLVKRMPAPLTLYVFARDEGFQKKITKEIPSGGVCINDALMHSSAASLPFGGMGESGMGRYHGKAGFDTFSHSRSVLKRYFVLDLTLRCPPYTEKSSACSKVSSEKIRP